MKIIRLTAENLKRLKAVDISTNGQAVQIVAGRNAQGKSSVLDSIWMALDWKHAHPETPRPIRDGEESARVKIDLGDLVVTRWWEGEKSTLLVENADGAKVKRPQELLDSLLGRMSFDPLEFTQQGDREQVKTLLSLVDLPFDLAELDAERAALYDSRTEIGRQRDRARGALESLPVPAADIPEAEESVTELVAELDRAQHEISQRDHLQRELNGACASERDANDAVKKAEAELLSAQRWHAEATMNAAKLREDLVKLPPAPETDSIRERIAGVEDTNARVRQAAQYRVAREEHEDLRAKYDGVTEQIAELDARKAAGLAAATFPIDGLSFGESGVTYNGVPFCQCSSAEQLRVSLSLAMAMNPELRVIRIMDGSLLDSENMRLIEEMAAEHDYQCWIERVDETGTTGVLIEDGEVVS